MQHEPQEALLASQVAAVLRALDDLSAAEHGMPQRAWVEGKQGKAFVRVNQRAFPGEPADLVPVFDLASITIHRKKRRRGIFREVLQTLEALATERGRGLVVESVFSPVVEAALGRRGYRAVPNLFPPLYWKPWAELQAEQASRQDPGAAATPGRSPRR